MPGVERAGLARLKKRLRDAKAGGGFSPGGLSNSGSLFIGMNLAVLSLGPGRESGSSPDVLSIVAGPVLLLLVPIFDTTLVVFTRLREGRSLSPAGQNSSRPKMVKRSMTT